MGEKNHKFNSRVSRDEIYIVQRLGATQQTFVIDNPTKFNALWQDLYSQYLALNQIKRVK